MASSVGTNMPRGVNNIIKNYRITVPSDSSEQQSIVSILSSMDYEMKKLKEKLEKTRHIKQGMMQQLLTGTIRLN
jgi:type I restriction enzyme S subunit